MKRLKIAALTIVALSALTGVASAAGAFHHADPMRDELQIKQEGLEARFSARQDGSEAASASGAHSQRGARGPRGNRGPRGPQGPRGATGQQGPAGAQGPKGTFGSVIRISGPAAFLCSFEAGSCAVGSTRVECPPGTTVISGGYTGAGILTTVTWSSPVENGWGIVAVNLDEVPVTNLRATAECAS